MDRIATITNTWISWTYGQVIWVDKGDPSEAKKLLWGSPGHALVSCIGVNVLRLVVANEHRPLAKSTRIHPLPGLATDRSSPVRSDTKFGQTVGKMVVIQKNYDIEMHPPCLSSSIIKSLSSWGWSQMLATTKSLVTRCEIWHFTSIVTTLGHSWSWKWIWKC